MTEKGTFPSREADQFNIRLSDGLHDRIKDTAEANKRSMNAEIVMVLENAFLAPATVQPTAVASVALVADGIGLRDWFAGQVLAALTVNGTSAAWEDDAVAAYAAADAMLAARSEA